MERCIYGMILILTGIFHVQAQKPEYRLNDTLYVWEMHGVTMIDDPQSPGQVKNRYYYGSPARVVDINPGTRPVSMEVNEGYELPGHWVRVIINRDTGFVFDGFLGAFPPFDLRSDAQGIELVQKNYSGSAHVSKAVRSSTPQEGLADGESQEMQFENGIQWELKKVKPCLIEKYTIPTNRYAEAYQFMMAVYSNYFDQDANFMAEPEFLRQNGNKTEFILRGNGGNQQIAVYKSGNAYLINAFTCTDE